MCLNKFGILVPHDKYFAANFLADALKCKIYTTAKKIECENLFIIGAVSLINYSTIKNNNKFKTVAVIFSDTNFCKNYKWCKKFCLDNGIHIYAMPDLREYLDKFIPAYQTITIPSYIDIDTKNDVILITHSAGEKEKYNYKGSREINSTISKIKKNYNVIYKSISGLSWIDCLVEKAKSHIFIDQLVKNNPKIDYKRWGNGIKYQGAIGKSGLEAMLMKCFTITGSNILKTEPYFPNPPIYYTDYYTLYEDLSFIIGNESFAKNVIDNQFNWAKKYLSPEFVVSNITRHINETV